MAKKEIVIIADYTQQSFLTLNELCEICRTTSEIVDELIAYRIIEPRATGSEGFLFDITELERIKRALRIRHDLELNLQGVALVLELLDERERMRLHIDLLEKHFSKL